MKNFKPEVELHTQDLDPSKKTYQVQLDTSKGPIILDLFFDRAPKHCANLIGLARAGFYDNLSFHRVIDGFVIQGGCPTGDGTGGPGYNVDAEFNDYPHTLGVLSMARAQDPNSAGSQFFLCLGDVPYLDNNYTAFGKVANTEGLEALKTIGSIPTGAGDKPNEDILIKKASVIESNKA